MRLTMARREKAKTPDLIFAFILVHEQAAFDLLLSEGLILSVRQPDRPVGCGQVVRRPILQGVAPVLKIGRAHV